MAETQRSWPRLKVMAMEPSPAVQATDWGQGPSDSGNSEVLPGVIILLPEAHEALRRAPAKRSP